LRKEAIRKGVPLGEIRAGSRRRTDGVELSWQLTDHSGPNANAVVPFLIDWNASPHPALSAAQGASLISLRAEHPDWQLAFTFFSHKVLRWLAPHCMLIALISNLMLVADPFYGWWFAAQCAFYGSALIGWRLSSRGSTPRPLRIPLFFVSMNVGLLLGSWKFVTQASSGVWSRSAR